MEVRGAMGRMQTWVTGRQISNSCESFSVDLNRGYTLIEVMVVILVIGLALSLVAVRLPPKEQQREQQVQAWVNFLQAAKESAIFEGRMVSIHCDDSFANRWGCKQIPASEKQQEVSKMDLPVGWSLSVPSAANEKNISGNTTIDIQFFPGGEILGVDIIVMRDPDANAWQLQMSETGVFHLEKLQ